MQLAALSLCSLIFGYLLAILILPIAPYFGRPKDLPKDLPQDFTKIKNTPTKTWAPRIKLSTTLILAVSLIGITLFCLKTNAIDVSPRALGADMANILGAATKIQNIWFAKPKPMFLVAAQNEEDLLAKLQDLEELFHKTNPTSQFLSLASLLPTKEIQEENFTRFKTAQETLLPQISAKLQEVESTINPDETVFAPFLKALKSQEEFHALTSQDLASLGLQDLVASLSQFAAQEGQVYGFLLLTNGEITNLPKLPAWALNFSTHTVEDELLAVFKQEGNFWPLTLVVCLVLLLLFLRNILRAILALIPGLFALSLVLVCQLLNDWPITLASLSALPLVIGLALDHGVLLVHNLDCPSELSKAILVSSLTACTSMGFLAFASHPALAQMGRVLLIGLGAEMLAALILIPKLCLKKSKSCA